MTVHELIKRLRDFNPDHNVYISVDGEGNRINNVYDLDVEFLMEGEWGDVDAVHEDDIADTEGEVFKGVVIWP